MNHLLSVRYLSIILTASGTEIWHSTLVHVWVSNVGHNMLRKYIYAFEFGARCWTNAHTTVSSGKDVAYGTYLVLFRPLCHEFNKVSRHFIRCFVSDCCWWYRSTSATLDKLAFHSGRYIRWTQQVFSSSGSSKHQLAFQRDRKSFEPTSQYKWNWLFKDHAYFIQLLSVIVVPSAHHVC